MKSRRPSEGEELANLTGKRKNYMVFASE